MNPSAGWQSLAYLPSEMTITTDPPTRGAVSGYTYDTWSLHYEQNGIQENTANPVADQATNGLDDDNQFGVDDPGERETQPPFAAPLRGIKITIRVYEPGSQQVRQMTVVQDFLPD